MNLTNKFILIVNFNYLIKRVDKPCQGIAKVNATRSCAIATDFAQIKRVLVPPKKSQFKLIPIWTKIAQKLDYPENDAELIGVFEDYFVSLNESILIPTLYIPAIIYTGPKEDLPDVFFNLNTGSVNL